MSILAVDLGGTKIATGLFSTSGKLISKSSVLLDNRSGHEVGDLIKEQIKKYQENPEVNLEAIGISVPGISRSKTGTVWAPNIQGWQDYPLIEEINTLDRKMPVSMDSDRACCILGEVWQGNAKGIDNAIFITFGTGIGAGILLNGEIIRGAYDIAGAIGWMALQKPFESKYIPCGNFEYYSSGDGLVRLAKEIISMSKEYSGVLSRENISGHEIFNAYNLQDPVAEKVFSECIVYWGMAAANLISMLNPEKIIFGGGLFGPAIQFINEIKSEAAKWAQPISMTQVSFEASALGSEAALYGAAYLAMKNK
ncbi:MAG: ROK family protein [Saprospiraceae bacterium]